MARAKSSNLREGLVEDLTREEQQGLQGHIVRRGGDRAVHREMGEKGADVRGAHGAWMACVMQHHEALHPLPRGFFRARAPLLEP